MLSSISTPIKNKIDILRSLGERETKIEPPLFEEISKTITVLHHRNAQLRNAILSGSEEKVKRRRKQFSAVLNAYVRLVVTELHGPISYLRYFDDSREYMDIRNETFSFYENMVELSNCASKEMIAKSYEFARELFHFELQVKDYQEAEQKLIYPLYSEVTEGY